ncbi:TonB-dependent receptor [Novosphingobium pentaromativorans]|uniref:TonB-dependent receptor n=1 Tax=Novosphingobium pentaromativorans US6-1 TaxID=1088721 RepID=G6EB78_9SPHN|nr:TonB-dependent receptor [Novosphingobium pentaromativorans]AIT80473.1 TonB-dependent receptor [Novosphingobium pentaromativorans US6-1]EHJ61437.1 TonB-dependent receptor [Novosphingobium pentaromativorans US6-1]
MKGLLFCSAAVGALFATAPALAQDSGAAGAAPSRQAGNAAGVTLDANQLAEIIVTAQRVEENSQRIPLALDVIDSGELTRQNVVRAEDLSRTSTALSASSSGGPTAIFYVRGVGNGTVNAYSDPAIAFNYDGVYIGRPSSTSGMFYDLQRVELLKGPQGTLYGRNATAGAINVIPKRPQIGELSGEITAGYGNYDWYSGQAALNVPIGDRGAFRLSGTVSNHDGFQKDGTGSQNEYGARAQVYAELTEALNVRVAADYAHQGGSSSSGYYIGAINPTFGPGGFTGYQFVPSGFGPGEGVHTPAAEAYLASRFSTQLGRAGATLSSYPYNDNDYWGVTAEINWSTDAGTLTVQPAYREASLDYQFTNSMRAGFSQEKDQQTSVEARWAGDIGTSVDYLLGAIYFNEAIDARAIYNQLSLIPFQAFSSKTESYAGFGKVTVHPVEGLSLTAGGRYTSDRKRFDGDATVYLPFCGNPAPPQDFCPNLPFTPLLYNQADFESFYQTRGIPVTPVPLYVLPGYVDGTPFVLRAPMSIDSALHNDKFTYRLAAQYDFTPSNMVYASFETGYHAGGFSFARGLESYEPESIDAYTIGSKNRFFGRKLQLNLEAFLWKYKNQQFSQYGYDLGNPPSTVYLTRNIGNSTIKGLDLDVEWLATPTTLLQANVQYLDTKYDSFVYFTPNQGLPPITSCPYAPTTQNTASGTISVFKVDCSGFPAFNSPKWAFNVNARQTVPLGKVKFVLEAGTRYRAGTWVAADYPTYTRASANFVSNASITLASEDNRWFVTAYILNIEDERRLAAVQNNSAASLAAGGTEQPRTYGIRVGSKF